MTNRIKILTSGDHEDLEKEVNAWLSGEKRDEKQRVESVEDVTVNLVADPRYRGNSALWIAIIFYYV